MDAYKWNDLMRTSIQGLITSLYIHPPTAPPLQLCLADCFSRLADVLAYFCMSKPSIHCGDIRECEGACRQNDPRRQPGLRVCWTALACSVLLIHEDKR